MVSIFAGKKRARYLAPLSSNVIRLVTKPKRIVVTVLAVGAFIHFVVNNPSNYGNYDKCLAIVPGMAAVDVETLMGDPKLKFKSRDPNFEFVYSYGRYKPAASSGIQIAFQLDEDENAVVAKTYCEDHG